MQPASLPYNRGMSHLDILIPFGLPPAELSADLLRELNAPALATLTARAKSQGGSTLDDFSRALPHETWLARQFGLEKDMQGSPPVAAALMQSLGLAPESGTWFVLQPVHIHIARDHLVLTDPRQLTLPEQESRTLFDIAKPLFDEAGKPLLYGTAGTWFARADDWAGLQTSTPDVAIGHNIDIWMPKGPGERDWRKLQNEVQMHWFNHPINEEREAHRLKPVNSIWLWGGATTAAATAMARPASRYTKAFNLAGWMQALGQLVPQQARAASAAELIAAKPEQSLLLLDTLLEPALSNDWSRWLDRMRQLETDWFAPLLHALKSGTIEQLSLIITHDSRISSFTATRSSLRKFWVKPSLATLCP